MIYQFERNPYENIFDTDLEKALKEDREKSRKEIWIETIRRKAEYQAITEMIAEQPNF